MKLRVSPMGDKTIEELSCGEVTTYGVYDNSFDIPRPVPGGVYCQRIFGPVRDFVCGCGLRRPLRIKVCPDCGVPVMPSSVRTKRYGHINTTLPYITPMVQDLAAEFLGVNKRDFSKFLVGKKTFVIEENMFGRLPAHDGKFYSLRLNDIESSSEHLLIDEISLYGLLKKMDALQINIDKIGEDHPSVTMPGSRIAGLKSLINFKLLVCPPSMREAGSFNGRVVYHPTNVFYLRALRFSLRAQAILQGDEMLQPLLYRENTLLQSIVNKMMEEGAVDRMGNKLQSILVGLTGKEGRFRGNLLGKRVDFSGRSVISSAPELKINEIGIPFKMMYELLKPDIIGALVRDHESWMDEEDDRPQFNPFSYATRQYKLQNEAALEKCWQLAKDEVIMSNRAPSLHRYSVMGFKVVMHMGKHIQFPNMDCGAYNADFDGDTMGVHRPLTVESRHELRTMAGPEFNVMSSASFNNPLIKPSHECLAGLYLATRSPK